jgi:hypothetical protein
VTYFGPLSAKIPDNKIDDIWHVDIAEAVAAVWHREFGGRPFVSLLNDGDADAIGAVVLSSSLRSKKAFRTNTGESTPTVLSVVKLGTGLAGTVLIDGNDGLSLSPGLFEWGKMVLDLAAPPREGFPQGVAAEYLSKRCLPRLAARNGRANMCFHRDGPDSGEIGLILQTFLQRGAARVASYRLLRRECGAELASRHSPWGGDMVSADVLKRVYDNPHSDPELLHEVRLALRQSVDVEKALKSALQEYGCTRLGRLIGVDPKEFRRPNGRDDASEVDRLCRLTQFAAAGRTAVSCAVSLGRYLGDFCVLLHDQFSVNTVVLTGGVLSGQTGLVVREAAMARVAQYGLRMVGRKEGSEFFVGSADSGWRAGTTQAVRKPSAEIEQGALGAACFAAASMLRTRKQDGLQRLASLLLPLGPGSVVEIDSNTVRIGETLSVSFGEYGVGERDLEDFFRTRGPDWGFYEFADKRYLRWVVVPR